MISLLVSSTVSPVFHSLVTSGTVIHSNEYKTSPVTLGAWNLFQTV